MPLVWIKFYVWCKVDVQLHSFVHWNPGVLTNLLGTLALPHWAHLVHLLRISWVWMPGFILGLRILLHCSPCLVLLVLSTSVPLVISQGPFHCTNILFQDNLTCKFSILKLTKYSQSNHRRCWEDCGLWKASLYLLLQMSGNSPECQREKLDSFSQVNSHIKVVIVSSVFQMQ